MYKAAVIGLGFMGAGDQVSGDALGQKVANLDGTHVQGLLDEPRVKLVAGSSRDPGRRERFAQRTGIARTYADWREMIAREKPEIVAVSTNSPVHAEATIGCAEAGVRAVFCEKPIATRLVDAERMIESCQRHGAMLVINHNRRWTPLWQMVKEAISAGEIGTARTIMAHWPTGRLGNIGTHMFDAMRYVLQDDAAAVSGTVDPEVAPDCRGPEYHDPGGWGVIRFTSGVRAFVDCGQAVKAPNEVAIIGDEGQIVIRRETALVERWDGARREIVDRRSERPSSVALAVRDIVDSLEKGTTPRSTGRDGLAALEIIVGFHASNRLGGQWVELPLRGMEREMEVRIG